MGRLEDLIQKYCPNGIEYKKIKEITNYEQPTKYLVKNTKYNDDFDTPVLTAGQTFILGYTNEKEGIFQASKSNPVIIFDDFTGAFKWVDFSFKGKSSAMKIIKTKNNVLIRYLYHVMGFLNYTSNEHKRLWISKYSELKIPVPPFSVQEEIVRILDSFTKLTEELTEELTERKKQYEYYHNELLNFDDNISIKKLFEVAEVYDSLHQTPKYSQDKYSMIRVQDIKKGYINIDSTMKVSKDIFDKFTKKYKPQKNDIVVSRVGSYGNFAIIPNDCCCLGQNIAIIHPNINSKYIYYVLTSNKIKYWINKMVKGASHKSFSLADIKKIPIPIPHIEEQKRIVTILDKFDTLCNDLSIGLPAEIEARKKQYEYYRDKLLTFKELKQ